MGDIKYFSFLSCVFDWGNGKVEGFKILLFGLKKIMFKKLLVHNIYIYIYISFIKIKIEINVKQGYVKMSNFPS